MTHSFIVLAAGAGAPAHLNPVKLFMDADIVVQLVMVGLLLASVWVWTIVVSFSLRMGAVKRADRAYEEGARTYFIRGQMGDLRGQVAEYRRYCTEPKADVTKVQVPVYVYQGTADTSVPLDQAQYWQSQFPNLRKARIYEGEGHDVQYRHWDQLLLDVAGHAELTMLCADGRSQAVPEADAQALLAKGAALGICAWR